MKKFKKSRTLSEQTTEKRKLEKNTKYSQYKIGMPVLLDLPKSKVLDKETSPKVL